VEQLKSYFARAREHAQHGVLFARSAEHSAADAFVPLGLGDADADADAEVFNRIFSRKSRALRRLASISDRSCSLFVLDGLSTRP